MSLHKNPSKSIVFVVPYPFDEAPGQRFRYEQYLTILKKEGYNIQIHSFLNIETYNTIYESKRTFRKFWGILIGFFNRLLLIFSLDKFEYIFIFREATPIGPPVFEYIVAKWLRKKIIYDFDDAIWITDNSTESPLFQYFKQRNKVSLICKWSYKISAGNEYLGNFAKQFNKSIVLNPTTIDTNSHHVLPTKVETNTPQVVIGWTGSHSTLKYLLEIEKALQFIEAKYAMVKFLIIANHPPKLKLNRIEFLPWSRQSEVQDLAKIDIGIMPLPDDEWTKGKCGLKVLQYMAMGIPAVASPIGVNTNIIKHNENGFLAKNIEDWIKCLSLLIENSELRYKFGESGIHYVRHYYSVSSNTSNFLSLFE